MATDCINRVLIRRLDASEFPRLAQVDNGFVPNPATSAAIVAEQGQDIVGRILLLSMAHVEGTWVREDKRKSSLGYRLMQKTLSEAKAAGLKIVMAYTMQSDATIAGYMERLGFEQLPVFVWSKET